MAEETYTEEQAHRHFGGKLNGEVWNLLAKDDRSATEDKLMVFAAHASCYHWLQIGTGLHHQRAEWMIARVFSDLGMGNDCRIRDLWSRRNLGSFSGGFNRRIPAHGSGLYRLTAIK